MTSLESHITPDLERKVELAKLRITEAVSVFGDSLFLGHSGGKDSTVIYHLTKSVFPDIKVVHTPKTDTHRDTIMFLYELSMGQRIDFVPASMMEQYLKNTGLRCQIDGTRAAEYNRDTKSTDLVVDGVSVSRENMPAFVESGLFGMSVLYPIVEWTDEEVFTWLRANEISISLEYDWI